MINIKEKYRIFFYFVSDKRTIRGHYRQQCKIMVYLLDSNKNVEEKNCFSFSPTCKILLICKAILVVYCI